MREIPLTQGKVAIVDDADYELVSPYKWYADLSHNVWYARANVRRSDGSWTSLKMHRLIAGAVEGDGKIVDHKDRDGLNNTRDNLRDATGSQNCQNKRTPRHNKSGYKGVTLDPRGRPSPWLAVICIDGKQRKLGRHKTAEIAARVYDAAAIKHFGEFAHLNFPEPIE